jgi:transposase
VGDLLLLDPVPLPDGLSIPAEDWHQTPTSVRCQVLCLLKRVDALEARLNQDSSNSSRPPSTDSPSKKRQRRTKAAERRKPGAKLGHPDHQQVLLEPTSSVSLFPDACACGHRGFAEVTRYYTHQVIELPVIRPEVTHWMLHQGQCLSCGTLWQSVVALGARQRIWPTVDGVHWRDGRHCRGQPQRDARPMRLGVQHCPE